MRIEIPIVVEFEIDEEFGTLERAPCTSWEALKNTDQEDMAVYESATARTPDKETADHFRSTLQRMFSRFTIGRIEVEG